MMKATLSKAILIRVNVMLFAFFLFAYCSILIWPSFSDLRGTKGRTALIRCSFGNCRPKVKEDVKINAALEEDQLASPKRRPSNTGRIEKQTFLSRMGLQGLKIGAINMEEDALSEWELAEGNTNTITRIPFEKVSNLFKWKDLFPEWIDEEQENEGGYVCPEIPMPDLKSIHMMDVVLVNLPCKFAEGGWGRDVFRLQVHLVAANVLAKKGRSDWNGRTKAVLVSKCRPMLELFRCDDLVRREGDFWYFKPQIERLEQKISLPMGSCSLALPLWGQGVNEVYDASKLGKVMTKQTAKEAYVTVLHSSELYVCGAITLAQSLLRTGTTRDLILLIDNSITLSSREALEASGWKTRVIKRIRNPRAKKGSYNEYNYSKFRLWQLTDYLKVIFIDCDIIVLRNLDILFHFPQLSAVGNDGSIFNSGIMVIEPSNCTFRTLMGLRKEITSYNGGDQGFLNEVFVWWHRLPRRVNFLKNFWSNTSLEVSMKNHLFGLDPPKLYSIHYLGLKPWLCYRDYDCNWDITDQYVYASDVAHQRWWDLHDAMDEKLQRFCDLTKERKRDLEWNKKKADMMRINGNHSMTNITDPRRFGV